MVTLNSAHYADMMETFGLPELYKYDPNEETLFQQDSATSHTATVTMNLLRLTLPGRHISRNGDISWHQI